MQDSNCYPEYVVLVVDDEMAVVDNYEFALSSAGVTNLIAVNDGGKVADIIREKIVGIVFLDLMMPGVSGREVLAEIRKHSPLTQVVIVTAVDDVRTAVECMKEGASEYLVKPVDRGSLLSVYRKMEERLALSREVTLLRECMLKGDGSIPVAFSGFTTVSRNMLSVLRYAEGIARTEYPVLITGETGVGKEVMANSIHRASGRMGNFVPVNIAGLGEHEIADVLFGHCKGAFTGADRERSGLIALAGKGTLFLDEIGDIHPGTQVKLLRFLADRCYYPIGCDTACYADVRIVAATNRDLFEQMKTGAFRADLFYRLNTHCIEIPPLRHRRDDIPVLLDRLIDESSSQLGRVRPTIPNALYQLLDTYDFPGNVRELQALVSDALGRNSARILSMESFTRRILGSVSEVVALDDSVYDDNGIPEQLVFPRRLPPLADIEHMLINEALRRSDGNQSLAAKLLKMPRKTLNTRLVRMRDAQQSGLISP